MSVSTNNTLFKTTAELNNATFLNYFHRLERIATARFEWTNLPNSCDERYLEQCLFAFGSASFLYDENLGIINTQAIPARKF